MGKQTRSINHRDALRQILTFTHVNYPQLAAHPDILAIITHWLQDMYSTPFFAEDEVGNFWRELLASTLAYRKFDLSNPFRSVQTYAQERIKIQFINGSGSNTPFPPPARGNFRFIDLFAGIGGFRIALESVGGKCVFSCDIDKAARETYFMNFGEFPFGDVRQFTGPDISDQDLDNLIPEHDILAAGFPCQPFSRAGVSARNSLEKEHGFKDEILGTLFFDIVRIAMVKRPRVLFLENVKNLLRHDGGNTFQTMKRIIEKELHYTFHSDVIDASRLVPQRRKRAYMVCFRDGETGFDFPDILYKGPERKLREILEDDPDEVYTISDRLWEGHQKRTKRNLERGTGFTAFLADLDKPSNTLVARYYKDGKECLIGQEGKPPRMLTIREAARLQGFPEEFIPPEARTRAYKQFGNAVPVPVATEIAKAIAIKLK